MRSLLSRVVAGLSVLLLCVGGVGYSAAAAVPRPVAGTAVQSGPTAVIALYRDAIDGEWHQMTTFPPRGSVGTYAAAARKLGAEVVVGDFSTRPDTAFFWSGLGSGGENTAERIATERHGVTLGMLIGQRHIAMPTWDGTQRTELAWSAVSAVYAHQASGTVRVILGPYVRPNAIWYQELDKLKRNPSVTRVISIDAQTGKEATVYARQAQ